MIELVVAKYNENTSWVHDADVDSICIYDKSRGFPNVGREAHTYLFHIVKNYAALVELDLNFIMCQGNPFDHDPGFLENIKRLRGEMYSAVHFGSTFESQKNGFPHHTPPNLQIERVWSELFKEPCPDILPFTPGAQFAVSRWVIRHYPLTLWRKALEMCSHGVNPEEAYIFERLWMSIFSGKYTSRL